MLFSGDDAVHDPADDSAKSEHEKQNRHMGIEEQKYEPDTGTGKCAVPGDAGPFRLVTDDEDSPKTYDYRDRDEPPSVDKIHNDYYYATI